MNARAGEQAWRNQETRPLMRDLVAPPSWEQFWPEPGLMWLCWLLGTFDFTMVGFIVKQIWWR